MTPFSQGPGTTSLAASTWKIEASQAMLEANEVHCSLDLAQGGHELRVAIPTSPAPVALWRLCQLEGSPLGEAYVRDQDLVACYEPVASFPFHTDIYWTQLSPAGYDVPLALQLVVSVRTEQLDTHPLVEVVTHPPQPDMEVVGCESGQALRLPLSGQFHLVEFATSRDASHPELAPGSLDSTRRLFGHFLEKGVIRRARLFAAVVAAESTPAEVQNLCDHFAASEWPLTA